MRTLLIPTDTQAQMVEALDRWLAEAWAFEYRQSQLQSPQGLRRLWQGLARELGLLGAGLPEAVGGLGGGLADQLLVAQSLGRALAGEPYVTAVVGVGGLLQRLGGPAQAPRLAALADGALLPTLAALEPQGRHHLHQVASRVVPQGGGWVLTGRKQLVAHGPVATHAVVSARGPDQALRLLWVDLALPGVQRRDLRTVCGGWASELAFDAMALPADAVLAEGPAAEEALARAVDELVLAGGAEAIGVMDRLMRDTVDYVNQRKQFGVAIASFQALQHRLADMHVAMVQARALVAATLPALDAPAAERARAVSSAQVAVARACRAVGQGAVQLHGGMGMTDELWIGHGFKRLTLLERAFGGVEAHLRRVQHRRAQAA